LACLGMHSWVGWSEWGQECFVWVDGHFWFVSTMWLMFLLSPFMVAAQRSLAACFPSGKAVPLVTALLLCIAVHFMIESIGIFTLWTEEERVENGGSTARLRWLTFIGNPVLRIWDFWAGMFMAQALLEHALAQDALDTASESPPSSSSWQWGWTPDLSLILLLFLSYGPPHDLVQGSSGWYCIYVSQWLAMLLFICSACYRRPKSCLTGGLVVPWLNSGPVQMWGSVAFAAYLVHLMVVEFVISVGGNFPSVGMELHTGSRLENRTEALQRNIGWYLMPLTVVPATFAFAAVVMYIYQPLVMKLHDALLRLGSKDVGGAVGSPVDSTQSSGAGSGLGGRPAYLTPIKDSDFTPKDTETTPLLSKN